MKTTLQKLEPLLMTDSFTSQRARDVGVSAALLSYYVKIGVIQRLGRGIFRGINAPTVGDFRVEDLANSVTCIKNGVICLISALVLYGLTEEIPREHWIAISNRTRHRAANAFIKIIRVRNIELGKSFIKMNGINLPIFDRERTIVDAFRYLGKETALKALKLALTKKRKDKIEIKKLRKYAKILRVKIEPYILALSI